MQIPREGFSSLDELARRPDAPVLVIQHHADIEIASELDAARAMYPGFVVVSCAGTSAHARSLADRDVVLWPMTHASFQTYAANLISALSVTAMRLRILNPSSPIDWLGPSHLQQRMNGSGNPIRWARDRCIEIAKHTEPPPQPAHVSDYVPAYIEIDQQDPVDLFNRRALPQLRGEYLPPELSDYIFDQSEIVGSDPCILGISALVSVATVMHDGIQLQAQRHNAGWRESARLWGMFIGDPGKRKTPAMKRAVGHIQKLDHTLAVESATEFKLFQRQQRLFEASERASLRNQANGKAGGYPGDAPQRPPNKRLLAQNVTTEAFAVLLCDNPGGILMLSDELSEFFGGMDAYSRAKKDGPFWLQCYNGGPYSVHRIGRESIIVPNLSACVIGGIQPNRLIEIAKDLPDDGLLQRFMPVIAQDVDGIGVDREPNRDAATTWHQVLDWLHEERPTLEPLTMGDDALKVREGFERSVKTLQRVHEATPKLMAHLGKLPALFVRLCLVYHGVACANRGIKLAGEIHGETAKRVARFVLDYLYEHIRAMYEDIEGDAGITAHLRWIGGHILSRRLESISLRTVYRVYKRFPTSDQARSQIMRALEMGGWLTADRPGNPGVATTAWYVNPRVHELFGHLAQAETDGRSTARELIRAEGQRRRRASGESESEIN